MRLEEHIGRKSASNQLLLVVIVPKNLTLEEFTHGDDLGFEGLGLGCCGVWCHTSPDSDSVAIIRDQSRREHGTTMRGVAYKFGRGEMMTPVTSPSVCL